MNFLTKLFKSTTTYVASDKGKAALQQAVALAEVAAPVVAQIGAASGSRTTVEIAEAFSQYGVPFSEECMAMGSGPAMLHLATTVLADQCPGVATNVLNTAVQIAVTGAQK